LERLRKRGYEALLTYYEKVAPHLNEPLYTRPVLQWCESLSLSAFADRVGYSIGGSLFSIMLFYF